MLGNAKIDVQSEFAYQLNLASRTVDEIHVRCIAHVVNIPVNDYLGYVQKQINQIRSLH